MRKASVASELLRLALTFSRDGVAHRVGGRADEGNDFRVVHARRPEHADRAGGLTILFERSCDKCELRTCELAGLTPDEDGDGAGRNHLVEELDDLCAFLEYDDESS